MASEKIIFTFNKFFYDLVKDLKDISPELKTLIKPNYKVKNNTTDENFKIFQASLNKDDVYTTVVESTIDSIFQSDLVKGVEIMKDITVAKVIEHVTDDYHRILKSFVLIFTLLFTLSKNADGEDGNMLFDKTMNIIREMQNNRPFDELLDEIFEDDVKTILNNLDKVIVKKTEIEADQTTEDDGSASASTSGFASMIENTKIGEIAKEISKDIDISSLNLEKPEDILNFKNNNVLGNIVTKVGSTLQSKFEKGELKHDELLQEAMGMLGGLGGGKGGFLDNPLFKELLKSQMGGMKGTKAKVDTSKLEAMSTRDRLRKKLEAKKAAKE